MGTFLLFRSRPEERCRLITVLVPAIVLYALLTLEGLRLRTCASPRNALSGPLQQPVQPAPASVARLASSSTDATLDPASRKARGRRPGRKVAACSTDGTRAKTFLLVFMGHSGSSAIFSELAAHSSVYVEDTEPVDHFSYEHNTTAALAYARAFFTRGIATGKIPGFKLRPSHIRRAPSEWARLVSDFSTRIIWQYRENLFKKTVGEYTNRYLNDSSAVEGLPPGMSMRDRCRTGAGCRFRVDDFGFFHRLLRDSVQSDVEIAEAVHAIAGDRGCVHALPYEDYLYARREAMGRLQGFLGLKEETHQPTRRKATSDNLCEAVENWREVCERFYACSAWRWMMDDERNGCLCEFVTGPVTFCSVDAPVP